MYEGDKAQLAMKQNFKEEKEVDKAVHPCTVIECQKDKETVHLLMTEGKLTDISLDAVYECRIRTLKGESVCTGMVKERYENRAGMILVLQILNGFYEIIIK